MTGSAEGYKGSYFEVDVLVDTDTDDVYLGELNPALRVTSMTNVTAGAYDADVPLFHAKEYLDVDHQLDVGDQRALARTRRFLDQWSQLVMKTSDPTIKLISPAPATGSNLADDGVLTFRRPAQDWHPRRAA